MYYASGCSIAKFPEDGIVIAMTLKDQGIANTHFHLTAVTMEMLLYILVSLLSLVFLTYPPPFLFLPKGWKS